ncbi:MAG: ADP-ribosylglycohydrolase family protein [Armatimonadota bacterium]|nr:ADP-ribosylglycohydrolase family protein [Armatimonadota bacterium]
MTIRLNAEELHDKVMGCWLGKSIGGTLGAPLEGKKGLFDLTYYDPVPEGAVFNDDLDIQLVWLRALQELGPELTTHDLGRYWLKYVIYPWDEYGYGSFNLRKGLVPPVSGAYNNWYVDCEGSPIRSEIWAMVAPAAPEVAARYAYADAIIDHAGGEGVWGEMYLAALESAAFVVSDPHELIEIGLSLIPPDCRTALAVKDVLQWHREGVEWTRCRELLLEKHGHYNPQDSPQNQGIVTLGWLYGEGDFGDAILKAVNCGEDTDCTGATLGSIMGIVHGADAIPPRWKDPVSEGIAVGWGIVGLDYPTGLDELTRQTLEMTETVLAAKAPHVRIIDGETELSGIGVDDLKAPELMREVQAADPLTASYDLGALVLHVSYHEMPTIGYDQPARVTLTLESRADVAISGELELVAPHGWQVDGGGEFALGRRDATQQMECSFVASRDAVKLQVSNPITVRIALEGQDPVVQRFPLLGERVWLIAGPFEGGIHDAVGPEGDFDATGEWEGRDGTVRFERRGFPENEMPLDDVLEGEPGIVCAVTYVYTSVDTHINLGLDNCDDFRVYLDGEMIGQVVDPPPVRPVRHRFGVDVEKGWHQVLVKLVGGEGELDFHFHLMDDRPDVMGSRGHGRTDLINTYLPDDVAQHFQ